MNHSDQPFCDGPPIPCTDGKLLRVMAERLITQTRGDEKAIQLGSLVEATVKTLVEFESELDRTKAEALEARTRMIKDAEGLALSARSGAISKAQQLASERIARARAEADAEAESITKKGESSLKSFEASISRRKAKATEDVMSRLLGETA
jgi:vacuolar-type H+-ATPase subunit H